MPSCEQIVAITGALFFSMLCFILPGLFFLKLRPKVPWENYMVVVAVALIPLGMVGAVAGIHGTIVDRPGPA